MAATLGNALLAWYARHHRQLPWRRTADPYKIWVSEIMLQQTQVQTVRQYYLAWLRRFPTVKALAGAAEEDVLKAWQGLGYYRRAKNLHRAAQEIMARHGGVFPRDMDAIRRLPGVGAYTAGAIASIAFHQPVCALDVNVLRVAARLEGINENPAKAPARAVIAAKVQGWIPSGRARWFNQALMELGALICLPNQPRCAQCPVSSFCVAYRKGWQDKIPPKISVEKRIKRTVVAAILRDAKGRVLIQKRPAGGLLGNLWEFPGGKVERGEGLKDALAREISEELGIRVAAQREIMTLRHAYTKFDVRLHVWECRWIAGKPRALWAEEIRWVPVEDLENFAYPSANVKIVRRLTDCAAKAFGQSRLAAIESLA